MSPPFFAPLLSRHCAAWLLAAVPACALAQRSEPNPVTLEVVGTQGRLSAGLPNAHAASARATWLLGGGDVARAEWLDERKFGSRGGVAGGGYTRVLSPDWLVAGTLLFGHGGPNWATTRVDVEAAKKWGEQRDIVTRAALYHASFVANRSDRGLRLAVASYLPSSIVLEAGVTFNRSDPGGVRSSMPFVSATFGNEGNQYFSLRASSGSEAYQPIGAGQPLVDFHSRSIGADWRRWLGPRWGLIAQAESYRNPSYRRTTLGAGAFAQW